MNLIEAAERLSDLLDDLRIPEVGGAHQNLDTALSRSRTVTLKVQDVYSNNYRITNAVTDRYVMSLDKWSLTDLGLPIPAPGECKRVTITVETDDD